MVEPVWYAWCGVAWLNLGGFSVGLGLVSDVVKVPHIIVWEWAVF